MSDPVRHKDHDPGLVCRPALGSPGLCEPLGDEKSRFVVAQESFPDDVRAIGQVTDVHGSPLFVAVYRGLVNIDGRMLDRAELDHFAQLLIRATWEAARCQCPADCGGDAHDEACRAVSGPG